MRAFWSLLGWSRATLNKQVEYIEVIEKRSNIVPATTDYAGKYWDLKMYPDGYKIIHRYPINGTLPKDVPNVLVSGGEHPTLLPECHNLQSINQRLPELGYPLPDQPFTGNKFKLQYRLLPPTTILHMYQRKLYSVEA